MKSRTLYSCIAILLFSPLFGETAGGIFSFERTTWNIGVESFSGDLPGQYDYLKSSLPDLVRRELQQAENHVLTSGEKERYRRDILLAEKLEIIGRLKANYSARDSLLFSGSRFAEGNGGSGNEIDDLMDKLRIIENTDPAAIRTPDLLPVRWSEGQVRSSRSDAERLSPKVTCKAEDLDFLISGTLREIEEYFRLEITGYDYSSDRVFSVYSGTGTLDSLEELALLAADELRSLVLGRAWTALKVDTGDPDALIYADGTLIGIGTAFVNTLEPGKVFLEAVGIDQSYWSREVELSALETAEFSATLSETEKDFVNISSIPEGADVYIGARWAGVTPLSIPRYGERAIRVTLRSDGYYDESLTIAPEGPDSLEIGLVEEELTRIEIFDQKKKEFYSSLGRFSLSVAGPVISAGVFNNYLSRHNAYASDYNLTLDPQLYDKAVEMERNYYISYGVFWGTVGISSGLLIDVFVKLSRYIKAAEALAE